MFVRVLTTARALILSDFLRSITGSEIDWRYLRMPPERHDITMSLIVQFIFFDTDFNSETDQVLLVA